MLNPEAGDTHAGGGVRERMIRERCGKRRPGGMGQKTSAKMACFLCPIRAQFRAATGVHAGWTYARVVLLAHPQGLKVSDSDT